MFHNYPNTKKEIILSPVLSSIPLDPEDCDNFDTVKTLTQHLKSHIININHFTVEHSNKADFDIDLDYKDIIHNAMTWSESVSPNLNNSCI